MPVFMNTNYHMSPLLCVRQVQTQRDVWFRLAASPLILPDGINFPTYIKILHHIQES